MKHNILGAGLYIYIKETSIKIIEHNNRQNVNTFIRNLDTNNER